MGFHEDIIVRENPLFLMQESLPGVKDYLSPLGIENVETNIPQAEPQKPLKLLANTLSQSRKHCSSFSRQTKKEFLS